jgi:hypothetical protein
VMWCLEDKDHLDSGDTADGDNQYVSNTSRSPYRQGPATSYSAANDQSFFRLEEAREIYKRKLRYFLARWGYSTSLHSLDLINEVGPSSGSENWHEEMCKFIEGDDSVLPSSWQFSSSDQDLDAQPHMGTGSNGSTELRSGSSGIDWKRSAISLVNYHDYCRWTITGYMNKLDGAAFTRNGQQRAELEELGSSLDYIWKDTAVWADRISRLMSRYYVPYNSGWLKPFTWTEFGYGVGSGATDWTAAYEADTQALGFRDVMWAGFFLNTSVTPWKMDYMLGDFGGGEKFWVFKPLADFITDDDDLAGGAPVDMSGLQQETAYSVADPENTSPHVTCSNPSVMVTTMRGTNRSYLYVKNLTVYWYQVLDQTTGSSETADITISGLTQGTYTLEKWRTSDANPSTQVVSRDVSFNVGSNGVATISVSVGTNVSPSNSDYAWAYKLEKN